MTLGEGGGITYMYSILPNVLKVFLPEPPCDSLLARFDSERNMESLTNAGPLSSSPAHMLGSSPAVRKKPVKYSSGK